MLGQLKTIRKMREKSGNVAKFSGNLKFFAFKKIIIIIYIVMLNSSSNKIFDDF